MIESNIHIKVIKKSSNTILMVIMYVFILGLCGCFEDDNETIPEGTVPQLVREKLDQKKDEYFADRKKICLVDILVRAEDHVDSIIINEVKIKMMDNLFFPDRPDRPNYPSRIVLDDSTKIGKLIK